ncbi:MAG: hypothetical protein ACEPOZ_02800 [Marinifilaceae bacterium]
MSYLNLIDFSVHPCDLNRFPNGWEGLEAYVSERQVDGVELLIGYDQPSAEIPRELVKSIHLPFWITWLDVWRKGEMAVKKYFPNVNPDHIQYCCGGSSSEEMVATQKRLWEYASLFQPPCAVVHAAHVELEHAFDRKFTYTDSEVLEAFSGLLNRTAAECSEGKPPVSLGIENLWWPGLTFLNAALVDDFAGQLEFDNWTFVLDTGHLMNTNPKLRCEDEAVDYILRTLDALSKEAKSRIRSLHLNRSLSGEYQLKHIRRGLPFNWSQMNYGERYTAARNHVLEIDQHLPFTTTRVQEIIEYVSPDFVVHEFITKTMDEFSKKLEEQREVLV